MGKCIITSRSYFKYNFIIYSSKEEPLFSATLQYPLDPDNQPHAPILLFNLQEIKICVDPIMFTWLLYMPVHTPQRTEPASCMKNRLPCNY